MKKETKRVLSLLLVLAAVLSWIVPVSAVEPASVTYNIGTHPGVTGYIDSKIIAASQANYAAGRSNFAVESISCKVHTGIKYYGADMIKALTNVGDYIVYRIQSPGAGVRSLTLKHGTFFRDGVAAIYVLPVTTQDIDAALLPANRVGKVDLYNGNTDSSTDYSPNHQTVVGTWEFGTDAEYFVVIECNEASPAFADTCYMQLYSLTVTEGELPVPVPAQREKSMIVTDSPIKTFEAATYSATGEINGQAHLFLPIEGKKMYIYNLETGEKFDEVDLRFGVTRGTAVDPDGKLWMVGSVYYVQCYDPATKTITDYGGYKTAENGADSGFDLIYAPNGCLYFGSSSSAHVFEFNISTKEFRDLGNHNPDAAYSCGIAYDPEGYVYAGLVGNKNNDDIHTREVVKIRLSDGECVGRTDVSDCVDKKEIMIRGAALCGDIYIAGGIEMNKMLAIDTNTMEQTTLYCGETAVTNPINFSVSEAYNGKHYFSLRSAAYNGTPGSVRAGLYSIEDATGNVEFVSTAMTTTMKFSTDSITKLGGKDHLMWLSGMNVKCLDMETLKVTIIPIPASNTHGTGVSINSLGLGIPGTGDIHIGAFNNDKCSTFNVNTGEISGNFYASGQTDCMITYQNQLFVGNYKSGILVQVDTQNYKEGSQTEAQKKNKVLLDFRYTNDPEGNPFSQVRVHALAAGDNKVFAGTMPDSYLRGGCIGWYDLVTGESYIERNVVKDQSIGSLVYHDGYLYGTTHVGGGTGAGDDPTLSAKLFVYDVANKRKVAEIDLREEFDGLPERLRYVSGIVADPNMAENGKMWGIVSEVLFSFTFDKATGKANFKEELVISKTKYAGGGTKTRDICFQDGYIYTYFSGSNKFCKINYNNPSEYTVLSVASPSHYVIGEDKNLYYTNDSTLYMYPLNVTDEDRAAAMAVDAALLGLNSRHVTLQDQAAIEAARKAYDALLWDQKALVSCLYLLEEAEAALLEVRINALDLNAPDPEIVNELLRLYDAMTNTQKRYVGNYAKLNQAEAVLSGSIYAVGTQTYATLEEAMASASFGTVIKLMMDKEEDVVEITGGAILDLNGYTLICDTLDATAVGNGHVIDSQAGKGLLMVSDLILLREDNQQMPLLDRHAEGYRFFAYTFTVDTAYEMLDSGLKIWYRMEFEEAAAYTLLANNACSLEIGAELMWNGAHLVTAVFGRGTPLSTDTFSSQWAQAVQESDDIWLFTCVNGLEQFGVDGTLEVIPLVTCCGVKAQTTGQDSVIYEMKSFDYGYTERG